MPPSVGERSARSIGPQRARAVYQPIVEIGKTRRLCGSEALARWRHPQRGLVPPDQFISARRGTGLITRSASGGAAGVRDAARWRAAQGLGPIFRRCNSGSSHLLDVILCALIESGCRRPASKLEITESVLLESDTDR